MKDATFLGLLGVAALVMMYSARNADAFEQAWGEDAIPDPAGNYPPEYPGNSGAFWGGLVNEGTGTMNPPPYFPSPVPDEFRTPDYGIYF